MHHLHTVSTHLHICKVYAYTYTSFTALPISVYLREVKVPERFLVPALRRHNTNLSYRLQYIHPWIYEFVILWPFNAAGTIQMHIVYSVAGWYQSTPPLR